MVMWACRIRTDQKELHVTHFRDQLSEARHRVSLNGLQLIGQGMQQHGYACLAVDLRSGMNVLGYVNETSSRAKARQLETGYLAAAPDIEAAIQYALSRNREEPVVLVGSSYSAALALVIASGRRGVKAVAAFSPGEYLKGVAVGTVIADLEIPTFVTAARKEMADVKRLMRAVPRAVLSRAKQPPALDRRRSPGRTTT